MTNDGQNQYLYDGEGLVCAIKNMIGKMVQYLYVGVPVDRSTSTGREAEGTRVAKGTITSFNCNTTTNGFTLTTSYILTPGNQQLTELTWSGGTAQWAHTNVWAAGQLLATYSADPDPTQNVQGILNFYIDDPLGTRRVMTDAVGNIAETCHSLPYGNGADCGPAPTEHLFTGKERDSESGNDYFGARYYASSMGRFLTPDWSAKVEPVSYSKLDDPQTLNLYAYVRNNPFIRLDADGHDPMSSGGSTPEDDAEAKAEAAKKNGGGQKQSENAIRQLKSTKALSAKIIEQENGKYNKCVQQDYDKTVVEASVNVTMDNVHEATDAAKESALEPGASPPGPKQNVGSQVSTEAMGELTKLHEQCLAEHPLAALSPKFDDWIKPGDVGKSESWLDKMSDFVK